MGSIDAHTIDRLGFDGVTRILSRYASTALGRARTQALQPSTQPGLIQQWLHQVDQLRRLMESQGPPPFGGITDIAPIVGKSAPPLRITIEDASQLRETLYATHDLTRYFAGCSQNSPDLHKIATRVGDYQWIAGRISQLIDERGDIRRDASPRLRAIFTHLDEAQEAIAGAVGKLLQDPNLRRHLQFPNHTFHDDRVVLPVKTEYRGRVPGIIHRTSDSGATIFVEPSVVVELNNRISDLMLQRTEEVNRMLWDIAHEIHLNEAAILGTLQAIGILDLITAKVRYANDYDLTCPKLGEPAMLDVRRGRHPLLLELHAAAKSDTRPRKLVVPIDYRLGIDADMLIVTGPNTGGKTVALKTIGLICLMMQAGLPVPADAGSTLGVFQKILIDIGDEQSMEQSLSTFSAHLTRLVRTIHTADADTLVLIDELGAGTDPDEGAAIGRAILEELLHKKSKCVVTTHLGALKSVPLTNPRAENASVEFDSESLAPTYRLRIGEPGRSNAILIAQKLGMPKHLIDRAESHLSRKAKELRSALDQTSRVKQQAERARAEAIDAQRDAKRAVADAEVQRRKLEAQQRDFQEWVRRVAHLQPGDLVRVRGFDRDGRIVRLRIDQHRAEVDLGAFQIEAPLGDVLPPETPPPPPKPSMQREDPKSQKQKRREENAARVGVATGKRGNVPAGPVKKPLPPLTSSAAAALKPGDSVFVKRFHRPGRVVRVNLEKQEVTVSVGVMEMQIPFSGVSPK
ncbi:MAG: endonuclease MutS2 [Phycisphaerae bacterium]